MDKGTNQSREGRRWFFYFSLGVVLIIIFKTIDSVYSIFGALGSFISATMPFVIAIIVAYILYIPGRNIEGLIAKTNINILIKYKTKISVFIVYLVAVFLIIWFIQFIVPNITESILDLYNNFPRYLNLIEMQINQNSEEPLVVALNLKENLQNLKNINVMEVLSNWFSVDKISSYAKGIVGGAKSIFRLFIVFVVSLYIMLERGKIISFLESFSGAIFNERGNDIFIDYFHKLNNILIGFLSGQFIDALIIGTITSIVMSLMHIKYAILLGSLIGVLNIIPYFGAIIAVIITIVITVFTGGAKQAAILAITIIIIQQIDANIINPKILGDSLNLSPILVIFSVTVGGAYFGPLGMFLGVPVMAFIKVIVMDFIRYRNKITIEKFEEELMREFENSEIFIPEDEKGDIVISEDNLKKETKE